MTSPIRKIGLYAGTFDPVHEGHVSLMRRAVDELKLDVLYCLPDRLPKHKKNTVSIVDRIEMLKLAVVDIKEVEIVSVSTDHALFPETLVELKIGGAELYVLIGSDSVKGMGGWRNAAELLKRSRFIVGVRNTEDLNTIKSTFKVLGVREDRYTLIETPYANYSSSVFREGRCSPNTEIEDYIRKHRLYEV